MTLREYMQQLAVKVADCPEILDRQLICEHLPQDVAPGELTMSADDVRVWLEPA